MLGLQSKLVKILERHQFVMDNLSDPLSLSSEELVQYSREYSNLEEIAHLAKDYLQKLEYRQVLEGEIQTSEDNVMSEMLSDELRTMSSTLQEMEQQLQIALIPPDADDAKGAIIEIRAAAGGDEASLFTADLFNMYCRYADSKKWKIEILSIVEIGLGGYKEASACISGVGVFAHLKFESGVHRVQRVPETESNGRTHTSTATVAILPEVEEIELQIEDKDLRFDYFRASGAGGQHVNTTDSAVRVTHLPTGIAIAQQTQKSQHQNKFLALKLLRAKLYEVQQNKMNANRAALRRGQIGKGDRSEKIRTYNYQQNRVTDHRINKTIYSLNLFLTGQMEDMINALAAAERAEKLAEGNGE